MRGLLRFLLYPAVAVGLVWAGSVAYERIASAMGGGHASADGAADAMKSAIWVP
jgi:hypothetical protein